MNKKKSPKDTLEKLRDPAYIMAIEAAKASKVVRRNSPVKRVRR